MLSKLVGINHVALEVDSIDEALRFYGQFFELHLRGVAPGMAFIALLTAGDLSFAHGDDADFEAELAFGSRVHAHALPRTG